MDWIIKKGDRVLVPPVAGRINSATVTEVIGIISGKELAVTVRVDGCSINELLYFSQLTRMEQQ